MRNKAFSSICVLCGALCGMCLLFPDAGFAIFIFLSVALYAIERSENHRETGCRSAAFCFAFCAVGYFPAFFITTTMPFWQNLLAVSLVYLLICVIHGFVLSASLYAAYSLPCPKRVRFLYAVSFWVAAEWLLGAGPFAWPTLRISIALWKYPALISSAKIGGMLLVSALIMAFCALAAEAAANFKEKKGRILVFFAAGIFIINLTAGLSRKPAPKPDTEMLLIQPGVKVVDWQRGDVFGKTVELLKSSYDADIILLSESILPGDFLKNSYYSSYWLDAVGDKKGDILVGGRQDGHSAVYQLKGDTVIKISKKSREVPFFENGLGSRKFYIFPNEYSGVFETPTGNVGAMICYESMFSSLAKSAVKQGAEVLAVLTNDSWFNYGFAKDIHLAHGVYRAVETGRTVCQAGLNGRTAVIDNNGNITYKVPHGGAAVLNAQVSLSPEETIYNIIGDWWILGLSAACFLVFILKCRRK